MAEKYEDMSPYNYGLNNPVIYVDPDGNEVEMCCDGLGDFLMGATTRLVDNFAGTKLSKRFDTGTRSFRDGTNSANTASIAVGIFLTAKGLQDSATGAGGLTASLTATAATGGASSEVTLPAAGVSAGILGAGIVETAGGLNILNNTAKNMKDDSNSSSSSSSNSNSSNKAGTNKVEKSKTTTGVGKDGKFSKTTEVRPSKESPGQSRAEYTRYKNSDGKVIKTQKDSYDRANKFQHRKPLTGGPEGRKQ